MVFVKWKRNCLGVSGTVFFLFAGLRSAGKTVRSNVRRHAQHALHRRRRQGDAGRAESAVEQQLGQRPPVECPMITGGVSRPRMIRS